MPVRPYLTVLPALLLAALLAVVAAAAATVLVVRVIEDRNLASLALMGGWVAIVALAAVAVPPRSRWGVAVPIVAVALAMRFHAVQFVTGVALGADPMNYTNIVHAMLAGRGMIVDDWRYGDDLQAYFPPLLPVVLTLWWSLFGDSAMATLALNTLFDAATAWCLFDIMRRQDSAQAGRIAALLFFAYPPFALAAPIPHKEALTILLVALLLRATLSWLAATQGRWPTALAIGALWALLALTQASLVLAPLAVGVVLVAKRGIGPVVRLGAMAAPAFLLVMAPWWLRNWLLFETFVPFTTASGFMQNVALGRYALPIPPDIFALPEPARSSVMAQAASARIAEQPLGFLRETIGALARGFAYEEATLARYRHTSPPIALSDRMLWAPPLQFAWLTLLVGTIAGLLWDARRGAGSVLAQICLALLVATVMVGMWFEFGERHRYVLTPVLMLLAARWLALRLRRI